MPHLTFDLGPVTLNMKFLCGPFSLKVSIALIFLDYIFILLEGQILKCAIFVLGMLRSHEKRGLGSLQYIGRCGRNNSSVDGKFTPTDHLTNQN